MKIPDLSRKFICNSCKRETSHAPTSSGKINKERKRRKGSEYSYQTYEVMECRECKSITLCIFTRICPGLMMGDPYTHKTDFYPPRLTRERPNWLDKIDPQLKKLLNEIYQALDCSLLCVASIGIRTALDRMIVDKISDVGSFANKVKTLEEKGVIASEEKKMLLAVVDAGSASAHRGFNPTKKTVIQMIDIAEKVLYRIYIEPKERVLLLNKADSIRKQTPPRKKRNN